MDGWMFDNIIYKSGKILVGGRMKKVWRKPQRENLWDIYETLCSCYLLPNFSYMWCALTEYSMYLYMGTDTHAHRDAHTPTVQQSEHKPQGVLRRERDGDDEGCMKSTKDLHRQSHDTLRKTQVHACFHFRYKDRDRRKKLSKLCWKPKAKDKKLHCISYSKWTFHMRIDWKLYFFSVLW